MCVKQRIARVHLRQLVLVIYSQRRILRTFTDQVGSGHRVSDTRVRSGHGSKVRPGSIISDTSRHQSNTPLILTDWQNMTS